MTVAEARLTRLAAAHRLAVAHPPIRTGRYRNGVRWASQGEFLVRYYPEFGGDSAYFIERVGAGVLRAFVCDDMPAVIYNRLLLAAKGA